MTFAELSSSLLGTLALAFAAGIGTGLVWQHFKRVLDYI